MEDKEYDQECEQISLVCPVCLIIYNESVNCPMSFLCGHSICLSCYNEMKNSKCPICKKEINSNPSKNFTVLNIIDSLKQKHLLRSTIIQNNNYLEKAREFRKKEEIKNAILNYEKAVEQDPNNKYIIIELIDTFAMKNDDYLEAIGYFKELTKKNGHSNFYVALGIINDIKGLIQESIETYNLAIDKDPTNSFAFNNLGISYDKHGQLDEALRSFLKAMKHDPLYANPFYNAGKICLKLNKLDQGIEYINKAIELNPHQSFYYDILAEIYLKKQDYNQTINYLIKSNEICVNTQTLFLLGKTYLELKKYDQAIVYLLKAKELCYDLTIEIQLASAYSNNQNYDKAIEIFSAIIDKQPNNENALVELGKLEILQNNYEKAIEQFSKVLSLNVNNFEARLNIARAYFNFKNYDLSIKHYNLIIKIIPDDPDINIEIGNVYIEKGKKLKTIL